MCIRDSLLTEEAGAILIATLNRPAKLNALSGPLLRLFEAAVHHFRDTPALKVMLIRARGRYFSAGADMLSGDPEAVSYTHLRAHETRHDLVCRLLLEKKKRTTT